MRRQICAIAVAVLIAAVAGCGSDNSESDSSTASSSQADGHSEAASGDDFCSQFAANGGDATLVGPLAFWEPAGNVSDALDERLKAMGDIEPPEEIAEYWNDVKSFYGELKTAVDKLPEDGRLTDPDLTKKASDVLGDGKDFTEYYFANCK